MPRWAWYAAAWFGGRAFLASQQGIPLGAALTGAIANPLATPTEIANNEKAAELIAATGALVGALGGTNPFNTGGCQGLFC